LRVASLLAGAALTCSPLAAPLWAADPCADFRWDITPERALFAGSAQTLRVGRDGADAPSLQPGRLYALQLEPQEKIRFALPPGRNRPMADARGGIVRLEIASAGTYRISLDQAFWVDVVAGGALLASKDFQGVPGCDAPHKIVEFDLPAANDLLLQISAEHATTLRLTVTRS